MKGRPSTTGTIVRALLIFVLWNLALTAVVFLLPQAGAVQPLPLLAGIALTLWVVRGFFLERRAARIYLLGCLGIGLVALAAGLLGIAWAATALAGVLVVGLMAATLRGPPRLPARWLALLRLRPPGPATTWTLIAIPVFLALSWNGAQLYTALVAVPPETLNPFEVLMRTPMGHFSVIVLAVVLAPVVEELVFRGAVQGVLERRYGASVGIWLAALLFAMVHLLPWILPLHFLLGAAFGYAVWASRSLWTGIILHTANNVAAVLGLQMAMDPEPHPTVWDTGPDAFFWMTLVLFAVSAAAFVWVIVRMRQATTAPTGPARRDVAARDQLSGRSGG